VQRRSAADSRTDRVEDHAGQVLRAKKIPLQLRRTARMEAIRRLMRAAPWKGCADMPELDDFLNDLKKAVVNAKTLEITTAVGPITWDGTRQEYVPVADPSIKAMKTKIDLFEGDMLTQMDPEFATGTLQGLRDYHMKTQADGRDIIKKNIEALEALLGLVVRLRKGV
jgi:hypothetical protein